MYEWMQQRQMLAHLGVKAEEMDVLDNLVAGPMAASPAPVATDPAVRRAQVAAFAAMAGGEVVDG